MLMGPERTVFSPAAMSSSNPLGWRRVLPGGFTQEPFLALLDTATQYRGNLIVIFLHREWYSIFVLFLKNNTIPGSKYY